MTIHESSGEVTAGARPVVLVRYRTGSPGAADCEVHLLPLPVGTDGDKRVAVSAMCGMPLRLDEIETVVPGEGEWCTFCFLAHVTGSRRSTSPNSAEISAMAQRQLTVAAYRTLGWPITLHANQVSLNLDLDVDAVALVIPAALATKVAEILVRRHCPPPVLSHPALPTHRIIVAGERFGVPLGWPTGVHRVTGTLALPPTVTAHGPVRWVRPPQPHALQLCREFDVCAALHTTFSDPPCTSSPMHF